MKKAVSFSIIVLVLFYAIVLHNESQERSPVLFVFIGQSNMLGYGRIANLDKTYLEPLGNIQHWHIKSQSFSPENPGKFGNFGPEVGFLFTLKNELRHRPIYILKIARPNSDLHTMWNPGTGSLYKNFISQYNKAFLTLNAQYPERKNIELGGVFWHQGESDAKGETTSSHVQNYQANLTNFLINIRQNMGLDTPVFIGQIHSKLEHAKPLSGNNFSGTSIVRRAQEQVANSNNQNFLVRTEGISLLEDQIHFDGQGQLALGQRYAESWLIRQK